MMANSQEGSVFKDSDCTPMESIFHLDPSRLEREVPARVYSSNLVQGAYLLGNKGPNRWK
ncbi:hypothetical protein FHX03_005227 [Rhizobium sp. BK456]|nr:hypothetical protein [Rhizobium sp. BK456]